MKLKRLLSEKIKVWKTDYWVSYRIFGCGITENKRHVIVM